MELDWVWGVLGDLPHSFQNGYFWKHRFTSFLFNINFQSILQVFWYKIEDIFNLRGWILMKVIVLETLWVALYMIKISPQNFANLLPNLSPKFKSAVNFKQRIKKKFKSRRDWLSIETGFLKNGPYDFFKNTRFGMWKVSPKTPLTQFLCRVSNPNLL